MHVHPRAYACITNKKSLVKINITWSGLENKTHKLERSILDSMLWIPDWRYWIPDFYSVELGLQIPIVLAGFRIPTAEFRIPKPMIPDFPGTRKTFANSGFQKLPKAAISRIPEFALPTQGKFMVFPWRNENSCVVLRKFSFNYLKCNRWQIFTKVMFLIYLFLFLFLTEMSRIEWLSTFTKSGKCYDKLYVSTEWTPYVLKSASRQNRTIEKSTPK